MNESARITFLAGEIDALMCAVSALVMTHPDPATISATLSIGMQARQAKNEAQSAPVAVPEAFLDGFQDMRNRILQVAAALEASKTPPT